MVKTHLYTNFRRPIDSLTSTNSIGTFQTDVELVKRMCGNAVQLRVFPDLSEMCSQTKKTTTLDSLVVQVTPSWKVF